MPRLAFKRQSAAIVILLGVWLSASCFSQVNTATVYGSVTDPTGATISSSKIEARNESTGATLSTTSNSAGQFTFNFVPIGKYTLSASAAGFEGEKFEQVDLSAGQTLHLEFQLKVGDVKESVTVSAEAGALNYDSAESLTTISTQNVHQLPLAKLDWTNLLLLGNGVSKASTGGIVLNGLAPASFNLTVDGTNASSDPEQPTVGFYQAFNVINTINTEAIAEVSTTKGIAPASVAGSMSGNVNVITKSGTNQFHGSLFELNSLSAYSARNQFLKTKPRSTFNEFGGAIGGPIIHDKLFFFADYEGVRISTFATLSGVVPTPEFETMVQATTSAYNPIFNVFPKPNQPYAAGAQTATFNGAGALTQKDGNAVGRLDYYINSTNLFTFRYTRSRPYKDAPNVVDVNPRVTTGHTDVFNGQFTHTETSWTSATRVAYNRSYLQRLDEGFGIGLDQVQFGFDSGGAENYTKRGGIYTFEENIAVNRGRHSIEFGGIVQRWNAVRIDNTTNTFSYSSLPDFLANIPSQVQINFPLAEFQLHMYEFGGFGQDAIRLRPNLTINLGLRYDYFTVPKERDGRVFNRLATPLGVGYGPFRPASEMYNSDWPNFAPRVGIAWTVGADRKTVVRAGSGLFYNPHTLYGGPVEEVLTSPNVPFRLTLNRAQVLAAGYQYPLNTPAVQAFVISSGVPIANTTIGSNFPNPYSAQWTLGVERELPHGLVFETGYAGNRGLHLNMVRMENLPDRHTGVAPDPQFGQFRFYDGSDASFYNAWQTSLKKRYSNGLSVGAFYTYANNISYGDAELLLNAVPQDNNNLRAQRGPTPYDIRHNFTSNFLYEPPITRMLKLDGRPAKLALDGWQISGIITAATGFPVNVTDSRSSYPNSRPDVAAGVAPILPDYTSTLRYLNPAVFTRVPIVSASGASDHPGDLGRNALRAPGAWNVDASLAKRFAFTERIGLQLRGDFLNAFNHTNLAGLVTDLNKSNFGLLTSATSRTVQIGAKLVF